MKLAMNISSWSCAQMMDSKGEAERKAGIGDEAIDNSGRL